MTVQQVGDILLSVCENLGGTKAANRIAVYNMTLDGLSADHIATKLDTGEQSVNVIRAVVFPTRDNGDMWRCSADLMTRPGEQCIRWARVKGMCFMHYQKAVGPKSARAPKTDWLRAVSFLTGEEKMRTKFQSGAS